MPAAASPRKQVGSLVEKLAAVSNGSCSIRLGGFQSFATDSLAFYTMVHTHSHATIAKSFYGFGIVLMVIGALYVGKSVLMPVALMGTG